MTLYKNKEVTQDENQFFKTLALGTNKARC